MNNSNVIIKINNKSVELKLGLYKGSELINLVSLNCEDRLHLNLTNDVDIPVAEDDLILINGTEKFYTGQSSIPDTPNLIQSNQININGNNINSILESKITGETLKQILTEETTGKLLYLELNSTPDHLFKDNERLILNGDIQFLLVTQSNSELDIPDLEECSHNNNHVKHQKYKIKLDKNKYIVHTPRMTGREILALGGYDESRYLYQKFIGGKRKQIALDEKVDFTEPGIERFHTMRCEHQEGLQSPPRHQFSLPNEDVEFLNSLGLEWECVIEESIKRVVIHSMPLPEGYCLNTVDVNIQINNSYPTTQIDMAYFYPAISRTDKKNINCVTQDTFDGKIWQRWSRHRTSSNPWQPGIDCIATHIAYINSWLTKELLK